MERFKKSLSANQQNNRLDIIKNNSRRLSPHDGFGLSQEHTQQDLSNTVEDAEKDLLHEIPKHEKLVGELLKAQSEYHEVCAQEQMAEGFSQERKLALDKYIDICKEKTKQLNEIYELGIQNQELAQIQELFSTFLEFKQSLNEPIQKLDKELQVYNGNISKNNEHISNINKQIENIQKDNYAPNSKPLSHWVKTSQCLLEIGDYKEIQKEYQEKVSNLENFETKINRSIRERNLYVPLLGMSKKAKRGYEKDIDENDLPVGESLEFYKNVKDDLNNKLHINFEEQARQLKICNKTFGSNLKTFLDNRTYIQIIAEIVNLIHKTLEEVPLPKKSKNNIKLIKDSNSLIEYLQDKKQDINELKYYKFLKGYIDKIEEYCNESIKLSQGENTYDKVKGLRDQLKETAKMVQLDSSQKSRQMLGEIKDLQEKISKQKENLPEIQKLLDLYDNYNVNGLKFLKIMDYIYKNDFLNKLKEISKNIEKDLKLEKENHKIFFNKYEELIKIGEEIRTKSNKLEGLIEQKHYQEDEIDANRKNQSVVETLHSQSLTERAEERTQDFGWQADSPEGSVHACQEDAQRTPNPHSTTSDRECHTSAESLVNTREESREANPNGDGAKERDDIERVAQMPDDPEHKPFRKTSSEKALAQRWQVEKLLPDFLSEVEKHKGYWNFLEEQKTSLENRENSLKEQIDECIKHQVFEAFKQEVQILLQKKERQVKEKSQEQIEPERFEQMTMQAVKNLLQKAKSNLQTRYQEKGRLISAAVKQIADQVDNPLNQQEGDQRVQEPANQKRDLKEVIESKLKQSLEKLQQSLEEAPLLLDDTRLENDLTGYIKELEKDFQSKLAQMQEREKRLQENNEQFEKMREEEKDIYSGTFLNEPPKDARAKYWNTIQDELLNSIRASEGYRFYDHTAILRYAEAEKQEKIEDIIRSIKNRYLIEKEEVIVLIEDNNHEKCIINKTIGDLVRDSIKEDYKQAKTGVDQAYDHYKMVSAEVSNNDIKHEEAKKETYTAKMCYKNAQTEVFKAYKSYEEAKRKAEQAEEQYKRINEEARRAEEFFMRASAVANEAHVGYEHARVEAHRAEEYFMRASAVANEKYVGYEHARVEAHRAEEYFMRINEEARRAKKYSKKRINEEARRAEEHFMRASAVANEAHVRYEHARVEAHRVEEFFMRASAVANETHAGYEHARVEAYRAEEHYMKTCAVANEAYQAIKNIEEKHVNYKQSIRQFEDAYSYTKVSYHNKIEALQMMNESIKRRALAEKELEAAERKLRGQYESLINALRHKKAQLQIIFRNTEKETNDIYSMPTNNNCLNNKSIYNEIGTKENLRYTKRYIDSLEKYEKSLIELQDKYNKYDETVEKVKTAEVLSENMKNMIKKNNQIYTEEQKIQEEIEKFDKRINEIKDYQKKLKNVKEVIYNITYKESLKLNEMEILGKEANEFNNILKEPAKVGIKRYQELDRMGEDILEMEKELEKKEEKALHIQNKLKDIKDEIFQIESDINYKKTQQENLKINIQTTRKEYKYLERKKTTIKKDDLSQFKGNSDEQINRLVSLQEHIRKIKFDMDKYSDLTIQNLIKDRNEMAEIINMVQDIFTEYMKYEQNYKNNFGEKTSKEDLRRYYDELKMNIQEFFTEYKTKRKKVEKSINNLKVVISSPKGNNKECIESLYKEICTLKAQYENLDKEKHDLEAKFEERRKEKHELEAKLKIPINLHINESELNFKKARLKEINGTIEIKNEKLTMYKNAVCTVYNDNIEQLKEARFLYDDTIVAGLKFQNVAESLCKTEEQEYSKEKARFLEEITRKIEEQNNEKIILQLKLDTTKKEIASKEAELSSKQEDRRSLQEELATIDREMEQLAKEIEVQKKEKEKLCDEAKDRVLSEAKFMRIKKSITDLALEKIAQIYDLALQDTKVPRVSPAVTGRIAQETVMPEAPRETQEAQGIPGQQAGPLAPRGHEDDFTSESSSDDELVVPFNRHEQVSAEDYIKNRFLEYGLIGENMRNASMEEIMRRIPFQDHMEKVITWEAQKRKA